jgi:fatty-acyl-CoA synthase
MPNAYTPSADVLVAAGTSVGELFRARARLEPRSAAIEYKGKMLTYGALLDRVNRLAQALAGRGIKRGDRVGLLAHNRPEYIEVELAAATLGAVTACLNWRLADKELAYCINLVAPRITIAGEDLIATLDRLDLIEHERITLGDGYERLLEQTPSGEPPILVEPEDGLVILYTSGTTGLPKGAMISHRAMLARALVFTSELGIGPEEAFVGWAPFFHMASTDHGLATLMRGGTVIVIDGYQPEALIDAAERHRVGWYPLIPGMIEPFIAALRGRPMRCKGIRLCGAMADLVAPHQIAEVTELLQAPYLNSFGSTETGLPPATRALIPIGEMPRTLSKRQNAFCEVKLVDMADQEVAQGEPGELAIRGPTLFSGYWKAEETNARDFRGGWFHMGDVFRRNEDGSLDFVDRAKYMIKTGGENVYPAEIERVILSDPRVADAAVVRAKDMRWGETPVAFVARNDESLTADDLTSRCRLELAGYKCPSEIHFIAFENFPRSTSGKIQRHELEARLRREQAEEVED